MKNEEIVVKPTIIPSKEFVTKGSLVLNGYFDITNRVYLKNENKMSNYLGLYRCTKNENADLCSKEAVFHQILPPIMSAKLTTKNSLFFRYGELEIIAKLPSGDWILTGISAK